MSTIESRPIELGPEVVRALVEDLGSPALDFGRDLAGDIRMVGPVDVSMEVLTWTRRGDVVGGALQAATALWTLAAGTVDFAVGEDEPDDLGDLMRSGVLYGLVLTNVESGSLKVILTTVVKDVARVLATLAALSQISGYNVKDVMQATDPGNHRCKVEVTFRLERQHGHAARVVVAERMPNGCSIEVKVRSEHNARVRLFIPAHWEQSV